MTPADSRQIRVLIVDDHPTFRMGLAALVNSQADMTVAAEFENGERAVAEYQSALFDVVLMDLRLPGMGGVEASLGIMSRDPQARIVVLTTYDRDEDVYRAIQAGAKSYLLKDMSTEQIIGTIRAVFHGTAELPSTVAQRLDERLQRQGLTPREQEVLLLLVKGRSNKEIAAALFLSEETVKSHLKTLFAKLGVRDRTDAAISAIRHGIVHLE
ncbi:MAG TPA: response regulator transcription factor [Opitutaceae bacterium]|jgi:DNA-binding NarL/FixJ family response regulator|nr:response regulator transcription factor [Opitutaceae bacterium]